MSKRVTLSLSKGKMPDDPRPQTHAEDPPVTKPRLNEKPLLSGRAAGIIGASLVFAMCAAALTYLAADRLTSSDMIAAIASAVFVAASVFASGVRFLNTIVELTRPITCFVRAADAAGTKRNPLVRPASRSNRSPS
jgi:hypothetical protein